MKKISVVTATLVGLVLALLVSSNAVEASSYHGTVNANSNAIGGNLGNGGLNGVLIGPPVANPTAGTYVAAQSVTLTASGATSIRYTTDGSAPTCSIGNVYSTAIPVASSLVIEAISCYPGNASSTVASYLYAINPGSGSGGTVVQNSVSGGGGGGGGSGGSSGGSAGSSPLFGRGDSNGDGKINILDFVALMANWGNTGTGNIADFNSDGKVDIMDFVILMANWTN